MSCHQYGLDQLQLAHTGLLGLHPQRTQLLRGAREAAKLRHARCMLISCLRNQVKRFLFAAVKSVM